MNPEEFRGRTGGVGKGTAGEREAGGVWQEGTGLAAKDMGWNPSSATSQLCNVRLPSLSLPHW